MANNFRKQEALDFHSDAPAGKIAVTPTKPLSTQHDLALAYSPGVAEPCLEIANNKDDVYKYTAKGNLVGVISNGTAVLGLGNIGPEASKPVMEGKGVLFKKFAGIDVFDIEIDEQDPDKFIQIVKALEPTFGGINLEDIKAPESFKIEKALREQMNIPVMHDDQHGTAIISSAALLNALEIADKEIEQIRVVVNGAGAAAMACTDLYVTIGVKVSNIVMLDSKGVIRADRENLSEDKARFATKLDLHSLEDAMEGADMFLGLSKGNVVTPDMLMQMAKDPIVFALANPDAEIAYELAMATRDDIIMATGRSDHPNQVNNVLGFPYIFRGALDVRATSINEEMKMAAVNALANLTKEPVPELVIKAYGGKPIKFGKNYIIPKPLDPRLITTISPAVAKAAMDSKVARIDILDWDAYKTELQERIGIDQRIMSRMISRARKDPKKVVFAEADNEKILKAAQMVVDERIAEPILLGNKERILKLIAENELEIGNCTIIDPREHSKLAAEYAEVLFEKRQRKGLTLYQANQLIYDHNYFAAMMLDQGQADCLISGLSNDYPKTISPALQIIGCEEGVDRVAGLYIMNTPKGAHFFADTTVNLNPTADELVDIIGLSTRVVKYFDYEPRVAVLSYSNFGSAKGEVPRKAAETVRKARAKWPDLIIDGDIQANVALNKEIVEENYPFSSLCGTPANTLIFPDLASGNIAYKLLMELGGAEAIGPILMGMKKSVHVLQIGSTVREIFNMVAIAVVDAQTADSRQQI
jgi:malate dehydrogenase (oxaloacetate-decarboxylating)(NADP+)